ncbi:MAG: thiamine phosphate synthase [Acidobacteriota bacterium]|nr:thiamine phosphate synthase [Acidobacteriota bacterium]
MLPHNEKPFLYLITKGKANDNNFSEASRQILDLIKAAVEAEISFVQIREKQLSARRVFELSRKASQITQNSATKLLINDRADIAFAAFADGVHLTAGSLPAKIIRQNFPENFIIGVSAHTPAEILNAKNERADFATFSPIFLTPNKGEPQGLEKLREVCSTVKPFPVIALGGVDETNFESVLKVGARGVAAIRLFNNAERLFKFAGKAREFKTI